jgi:hypothetical protein
MVSMSSRGAILTIFEWLRHHIGFQTLGGYSLLSLRLVVTNYDGS